MTGVIFWLVVFMATAGALKLYSEVLNVRKARAIKLRAIQKRLKEKECEAELGDTGSTQAPKRRRYRRR